MLCTLLGIGIVWHPPHPLGRLKVNMLQQHFPCVSARGEFLVLSVLLHNVKQLRWLVPPVALVDVQHGLRPLR